MPSTCIEASRIPLNPSDEQASRSIQQATTETTQPPDEEILANSQKEEEGTYEDYPTSEAEASEP